MNIGDYIFSYYGQKILIDGDVLYFGANNKIYQVDLNNNTFQSIDFPENNNYTPFGSLSLLSLAGIDNNLNSRINLYPNPASGFVKIENNTGKEIEVCKVLSINGQLLNPDIVINNDQLDVQSLSKGIYLIKITLKNGQSLIRKLVKK